jgi:hypothetical protein
LKGQLTSGYTGPTKQGVLLQPSDADQLSELLAEAVVRAEAIATEGIDPIRTEFAPRLEPPYVLDREPIEPFDISAWLSREDGHAARPPPPDP